MARSDEIMLPEDVRDEVMTELDDLEIKINNLGQFIYSSKIKGVSKKQAVLLHKQLAAMELYREALIERLEDEGTSLKG